ncbi:MAG: HNH endonuclease [Minisyncoccia bacterium]
MEIDSFSDEFITSRFRRYVRKNEENDCLLWKGYVNAHGYGVFRNNGKVYLAHRFSWEINVGKIPRKFLVCHKCDIRNCVNPDHLFLGTIADNIRDCANKNRLAKPIWALSKLSFEEKQEIIDKYNVGISQRKLANSYGVSQPVISKIINKNK